MDVTIHSVGCKLSVIFCVHLDTTVLSDNEGLVSAEYSGGKFFESLVISNFLV